MVKCCCDELHVLERLSYCPAQSHSTSLSLAGLAQSATGGRGWDGRSKAKCSTGRTEWPTDVLVATRSSICLTDEGQGHRLQSSALTHQLSNVH